MHVTTSHAFGFGQACTLNVVWELLLIVLLWLHVLLGLLQLDESSVLRCVVRAAAGALHSQHMEGHRTVSLAVVTHNLQ